MRTTAATASTAAVLALVLLAGCAAAPPEDDAAAGAASSATVRTPGPDPVEVCARQVRHWVGESLRAAPDQGFDYQHMGLSGATYEVVRSVTAEARAASGDTGALVARRALEECRALQVARSSPTDGAGTGWP